MYFKKFIPLALVILVLALLNGCAKKPSRPNPLDTVMGSGQTGPDVVDPTMIGGDGFIDPSDAIETRDPNDPYADAERGLLPSVYFDFDSASIKPEERSKVNEAADFLRSNPGAKLVLEGHCDWRGTAEYNLALGDRRSESVASYLQTLGASEESLVTLSKGDLNAEEGATSQQMALDRRVEFLVLR